MIVIHNNNTFELVLLLLCNLFSIKWYIVTQGSNPYLHSHAYLYLYSDYELLLYFGILCVADINESRSFITLLPPKKRIGEGKVIFTST